MTVQPLKYSASFGRNEKCPCGSGKKFKHCHYGIASSVRGLTATAVKRPEKKAYSRA